MNDEMTANAREMFDCLTYCLGILESIPTQTLAAIEDENLDECVDFHRIRVAILKAHGESHES